MTVAWGLGLVALVTGCGRIDFDAIVGGDPEPDAMPSQIDAVGGFGAPIVSSVSMPGASDHDPCISADGLELYFASDRPGSLGDHDIWVARRLTFGDAWGPPVHVPELSSTARDIHPHISRDGLAILITSRRPSNFDIYVATRPTTADPWSIPTSVVELSDAAADDVSAGFGSPLQAVLSSTRVPTTMGTLYDLYATVRVSATTPWATPQPVVELNTTYVENGAYLDADGTFIAFYSDRPGGLGYFDIFSASRADASAPFDPPMPIDGVNSPADDTDPWLTPDGRTILFSSDRTGEYEIYEATIE
jgi:Tol biopolymer transport system component